MDMLTIRVETLRSNLEKIRGHLQAIPDPRRELEDLEQHLKTMSELLRTSQKIVLSAKIDSEDDAPKISEQLKKSEEYLNGIRDQLTSVKSIIHSMRNKCFRIQDHAIGIELIKDLEMLTKPSISALKTIQTLPANPKQRWDKFSKTAKAVNAPIFAEYIEFLGGLAVRDTGFDEGISKIADELIRTYSSKRDSLDPIAIPTREQAFSISLARVIRVTFPDWSIWSLPSTAHEFWHVMARKELEDELQIALRTLTKNDKDTVEQAFDNCLADAFATYTMGPAYPCYAILLQLNPSSPYAYKPTDAADDVRAHAICQMLECMDSKEESFDDPPYAKVRQELSKAWADAIAETLVQPTGKGKARTEKDKERIEKDKARVTLLVKALWAALSKSSSPPFTAYIWNTIKTWVIPLRDGKADEIQVPKGAELRHVLNAAWLARVDSLRNPDIDITVAANSLAKRIIERQF